MRDFAVFILSHGRSDRVYTYDTLRSRGYTGKIYIVLDDLDNEIEEYKKRFENVVIFSKADYARSFDIGDNGGNDKVVVYARNAMPDIARQCGYRYYVVLDDDYKQFLFRWADGKKLAYSWCNNLDDLFECMFEFLDVSGAKTVCFAQGGDFIGGVNAGTFKKRLMRKAMNVWFMDTEKPFEFLGRINEDTTTYVVYGSRGDLFFTICDVMINQVQTQANKGGLTDIYVDMGTYYKSFYTVMMSPSNVKVAMMGDKHKRIHHLINWNACTPKILNEKYRKIE
jgi:hypothetical protein